MTLVDETVASSRRPLSGREAELSLATALLADAAGARVLHVHGPAGIGKSALLRAIAGCALESDMVITRVAPETLADDRALDGRPSVLFADLGAAAGDPAEALVGQTGAATLVVVASRRPPASRAGGWTGAAGLTRRVRLRPLPHAAATELARSLGAREDVAREAAAWSRGVPAAIVLAREAGALRSRDTFDAARASTELAREVLARLLEGEDDPRYREALAIAALVRVVSPELLAAAGIADCDGAYAWLTSLSAIEPGASGLTLADGVRALVRQSMATIEPDLDAELRGRLADHLAAVGRSTRVTIDLAELVLDADVRRQWGVPNEGGVYPDALRPGDEARLARLFAAAGLDGWWALTVALVSAAPERVTVARHESGDVLGFAFAVLATGAPACARSDPLLGPWLRHAAAHAPGEEVVIWRDALDLSGAGEARTSVQAVLNTAGMLRAGAVNPRRAYLAVSIGNEPAERFAARVGGRREPALDVSCGGRDVQCWIIDYGDRGLVGAHHEIVHSELGRTSTPEEPVLDREVVESAIASLADPVALAASPLAAGAGVAERAEHVRRLVDSWIEVAFPGGGLAELDRAILRAALFEGHVKRELSAAALGVSRTTFFRRLKAARRRLVSAALVTTQGVARPDEQ